MIKKTYANLVKDTIKHDFLGPIDTILENKDWVCYCGETNPVEELEGIVNYLTTHDIDKIIMITFNSLDDIEVTILKDITYKSVSDIYHDGEYETPWKNTILTTENIDFICFKDTDNTCYSVCGKAELVRKSFFGWDYDKMKEEFMKYAIDEDEDDNLLPNEYWMKFFETYDKVNKSRDKQTALLPR